MYGQNAFFDAVIQLLPNVEILNVGNTVTKNRDNYCSSVSQFSADNSGSWYTQTVSVHGNTALHCTKYLLLSVPIRLIPR
jgi:hypothetical protein